MNYLYPLNQVPNFFVWWYAVKGLDVILYVSQLIVRALAFVNIVPMFLNIYKPFYQDSSISGLFFSIFLRIVWIFVGLIIFIPMLIVLISSIIIWFILPIVTILGIFGLSVI